MQGSKQSRFAPPPFFLAKECLLDNTCILMFKMYEVSLMSFQQYSISSEFTKHVNPVHIDLYNIW